MEANDRLLRVQERMPEYPEIRSEVFSKQSITFTEYDVKSNLSNIISDCQICIETSTKLMFKLMGMNHPKVHNIEFTDERTKGFLNRIPEDFPSKSQIPRVIFLTQFWKEYYTEAKYGIPEQNLTPHNIFRSTDAIKAVDDAEYCVDTAKDLFNYICDEEGLDQFDGL